MDNNIYFVHNTGFCKKEHSRERTALLPINLSDIKDNTYVIVQKPFIVRDPNNDLIVVKRFLIVNKNIEFVVNSFISFPMQDCHICTKEELINTQPTKEQLENILET